MLCFLQDMVVSADSPHIRRTRGYHVGLIPDGNRRWARQKGLTAGEGHAEGSKKTELFIDWCIDNPEIAEITVYGLSEENFKRSSAELENLYRIYQTKFLEMLAKEKIHKNRVRVSIISTRGENFPKKLRDVFHEIEERTKEYDNKQLNFLMGYTGQAEIICAVTSPLNRVRNLLFGLSEKDMMSKLKVKNPCDFIVRTAEEENEREAKSGFLLWQSAYAEYYHIKKWFPDITEEDLNAAWRYFKTTGRRKGL